jgi:hypothetical protein
MEWALRRVREDFKAEAGGYEILTEPAGSWGVARPWKPGASNAPPPA